jgi:hypothetical protein
MCWMCDHPGSTRADYLDHMRGVIACCGWAVQGVEREGFHPPWAYTVGLTLAGRPELVVTGMSMRRAARLLNEQAEHMLHAGLPAPGEPVELIGGPVIQVVEVAEPTAHLSIAVEMFGPGIRALQVVHADDRRCWPWEPGYRGVRGGQPVLGPRALTATAQPADSARPNSAAPTDALAAQPDATSESEATRQPGTANQAGTASQPGTANQAGTASQPGTASQVGPRSGTGHRRVRDRRTTATRRNSRGLGRRRAGRGPRRRCGRSPARPPSPPR